MRIGVIETGAIVNPPKESESLRIKALVKAISESPEIGLDIETGFIGESPRLPDGSIDYSTLSPETGEIKSIQIYLPYFRLSGKTSIGVFTGSETLTIQLLGEECWSGPVLEALLNYVQTPGRWTAIHNALYEGEWFLASYGVSIDNAFCTLIGHQMETSGLAYSIESSYKDGGKKTGANALRIVAERKLGIILDKALQQSDWCGELSIEQSRYAVFDAYLAWKLYEKFRYLLDWPAGQAEMGVIPVFASLNRLGMPASLPKLKELSQGYALALSRIEGQLSEYVNAHLASHPGLSDAVIPKSLSKVKRAEWKFNLGSWQQVLALINSMLEDAGQPPITKTDASTLEKLDLLFAKRLSEYRSLGKMLDYVNTFIKNYRHSTGTVMCKYSVLAYKAAAGRSSASDGSLQIVGNTSPLLARENLGGPKTAFAHSRIEPGETEPHVAVKCDLPASHLQLVAALTGDDLLTYCLSHDEKVHYHTLARMLQLKGVSTTFDQVKAWFTKPDHGGVRFYWPDGSEISGAEIKALYTLAKNVIYSFLNFAGAKSLQTTFLKKGIHTTEEECKVFLQACKDMYQSVYRFQRTLARNSERELNVVWDVPHFDEKVRAIAHLYGASLSARGPKYLTKAVRKQMPDGRWLNFPGFAQPVSEETEDIVDTADEVIWKCRPADIIAAHWLSTEATIMKKVAAKLFHMFKLHPEWGASIRAFAHDEVVIWVKARYVAEVSQLYMETVAGEFRKFVPFFQPEAPTVMENWEKVLPIS